MRAEIIFVGTELLLGQIINSNAAYLGRELSALGIDCYYQTVVGDNKERIKEVLGKAFHRADLIITSGGLGPTSDDLTTESCAEFFNEEMVLDEVVLRQIEEVFAKRNLNMPPSNKKQALRPKSANVLPNPMGTAPGIIWNLTEHCKHKHLEMNSSEEKLLLTFPGVPKELYTMWRETAQPFLVKKLSDNQRILIWKELKFYGISESALAEKVQDLLNASDPTVAPLAGNGECRLRLATKVVNRLEGLDKLALLEKEIRARVGEYIYGVDEDTLESVVAERLRVTGTTLALAESCTGGLLSQRLTDIPGASTYTRLNVTVYSDESKSRILNVPEDQLKSFGAVSSEVALSMARGIKQLAHSDYGFAVTGIAGPSGGTAEKPVGTVFLGLVGENIEEVKKLSLGNRPRLDLRWKASQEALNWLRQKI